MNRKKSKALAFLLAASLLIPSANGIVSAEELRKGDSVKEVSTSNDNGEIEDVKPVEDSRNNPKDSETTNEKDMTVVNDVEGLKKALADGKKNIEIVSDLVLDKGISINTEGVNIKGHATDNKNKISIKGGSIFTINANNVNITNLKFENTKDNSVGFRIGKNITTTINKCEFVGKPITNLVVCDTTSALKFIGNTVKMNARALIVGVNNGSVISENDIDLINEHYNNGDGRTGVLSFKALESQKGNVSITNNTFRNANRVIGVDHSNIDGSRVEIKNNKFLECRFAFEAGSKSNKDNKYDLSNNYFTHKESGGVGSLKIQNADATNKDNFKYGEGSTELKLDNNTPVDFVVGPYYTKEDSMNDENLSHAGIVTVNGKDYSSLEKAIKSAKTGETITLLSDITEDNWVRNQLPKGIIFDGAGHTIKVKNLKDSKLNTVLLSGGESTFKNINIDLTQTSMFDSSEGIVAGDGDIIENVNIEGRFIKTKGIDANSNCKELTIKNSHFKTCAYALWFDASKDDKNRKANIINNEFEACTYASILYPETVIFEGNTVRGGSLNIMNEKTEVKGNIFTTDSKSNSSSRVKFYTEGNEKTFKYNKIINGRDNKFGASIVFANAKERKEGAINPNNTDLSKNFWGDRNPQFNKIFSNTNGLVNKDNIGNIVKDYFKTEKDLDNTLNPKPNTKSSSFKPSKEKYNHEEIIGSDRHETAARIADKLGSYDTAVLVNATSTMSDGLSAAGLAGKKKAAILLVKKDSIPKATMDRLKKVRKVYIIGGESAISEKVANKIKSSNTAIKRLGGKNRVETSQLVAKEIGNYSSAFVVNGFDGEADAMSASPVAAKSASPILLTDGKISTHDKKSGVKYYVIGGENVVSKNIVNKHNAERLAGKDRYETNKKVISKFYPGLDKIYLANGETLVDALTASTIAKDHGIALVHKKSDKAILKDKHTVQVGGMKFKINFEK